MLDKRYSNNKKYQIGTIASFLVLLIICGFREYIFKYMEIGVDYDNYKQLFYQIDKIVKLKDSGFNALVIFIKFFTTNHIVFFLITSFIINFCFYKFCIDNSIEYKYSIFIFIAFGMLALSLNIIRQYIACGIFLLGFKYIYKKEDFFKYSIFVLIASLFHSSAVVLIVLPFLLNVKWKVRYRILALILLSILLINNSVIYFIMEQFSIIDESYLNRYWETENISASNYTVFIISLMVLILILFNYSKFKESTNYNIKINYLLLLVFVSFIAPAHLIYSRFLHYFLPAMLISVPEVFSFFKGTSNKLIRVMVTIAFGLVFFL